MRMSNVFVCSESNLSTDNYGVAKPTNHAASSVMGKKNIASQERYTSVVGRLHREEGLEYVDTNSPKGELSSVMGSR